MATVTIERNAEANPGLFSAYSVEVNGATVTKIRAGGKVSFKVQPGDCELVLKMAWNRSNKIEFVAHDDEEIYFKCGRYSELETYYRLFRKEKNRCLWLILDERKGEVPVAPVSEQKGRTSQRMPAMPPTSIADELKKLADLRESGVLSPDEFQQQKSKLLGQG